MVSSSRLNGRVPGLVKIVSSRFAIVKLESNPGKMEVT